VIPKSRRFREAAFIAIGVITPLGILAVNGSAFVMRHLADFRLVLSICALVSALFLNGLAAWAAMRRARRHVPDLLAEYRYWIWAGIGIVVTATAAGGAYFTYLGMRDPNRLPDPLSVATAVLLLLMPVAVTFVARRLEERRSPARRAPQKKEPLRRGAP